MLDLKDFQQRDLGRWLPHKYRERRERGEMDAQEQRAALCADALWAALRDRMKFGRALYRGEALTFEMWPELGPLTAKERTAVIRELRRILDVPERPVKP